MGNATFTYGILGAIFFAMIMVAVAIWLFWLFVIGLVIVLVVFEVIPYLVWEYREWRSRRRTPVRHP